MVKQAKMAGRADGTATEYSRSFVARVRRTIMDGRMLREGDRVLVAVSGGADSVALWCALVLLAEEMSLSLAIVHINYHLRGSASDADEQFCRELAVNSSARIYVRSRSKPKQCGKSFNLQHWARQERYNVFEDLADRHGFTRIAVGHQYDDQVETVAAGFFGGRDSFALAGFPRVRGRVIRPLYDCRRSEILGFLRAIRQPHREDASNRDPGYLRNRVRHKILPELRRKYNSSVDDTLFRWAALAAEQRAFFEQEATKQVRRLRCFRGHGWLGLDLRRLRRCCPPLDYYILLESARRLGIDNAVLSGATLGRFRQLLRAGRAGQHISWGAVTMELSQTAIMLYLRRPKAPRPAQIDLAQTALIRSWGMEVACRVETRKNNPDICLPRGAWRFLGDAARIVPPVVLRGPDVGEKITPMGMSGHKKIYDLLSEAGVPSILRARTPVLADRKGVFWVVGHRQDERVRVTSRTRRIISISLEDRSKAHE